MTIDDVDDTVVPPTPGRWRSLVPHEQYSSDAETQVRELQGSALLQRFAESRRRLATDRYRPLYHFVSPESRLNDPNGLTFWHGRWHLFYQAYPPEDDRQHWGHAVSSDLINWNDLPYAIYPDPERAVYSGSTLVEDDRVIAMYHGHRSGNYVAVADDPLLLTWTKLTGGPVIAVERGKGLPESYNVFDPTIWKRGDTYYSLSAGKGAVGPGARDVASASLFRSMDLVNWEYLHEFVEGDRFTLVHDDYACPYFLPLGNRHVLLFYSHATGGQYVLGDYDTDRDKLVVTHAGKFNFGPATPGGVHAPSATAYESDAVVVIFNMNEGMPTGEWDQVMTLPRILRLEDGDRVTQEPVPAVASLRSRPIEVASRSLPANQEVVIREIRGDALELELELDVPETPMLELKVLRSSDGTEFTRIVFMRRRGSLSGRDYRSGLPARITARRRESIIFIDTSSSSLHAEARPRGPESASFPLDSDEPLRLRVFVDRSIVEVFANERQVVAARVYPLQDDALGISIRSQGGESHLTRMVGWTMSSIY